jgi:hypothetical protein
MAVFDGVVPAIVGAANAAAGYQIDRSVRLNSANSANFSRTPSSAGNRKTWTWSCWYKRTVLGTKNQKFFSCLTGSDDNTYLELRSFDNDTICLSGYATNFRVTDAEIRDPSAWYHLVVACDTTQSSNSDRVKLYINGVQQTFRTEATITQNADLGFNQATEHKIGDAFDGYLAEIHFVDGTQLAASDFGEYDSNNVWQPKDCKDDLTYGTNGFYLKFDDNSSNAALGTDSSGNSNTWTVNNISAGASSGTEVTAAWAGYVGAWNTSDTWNSLSLTGGFGTNPGAKGYSATTETWANSKSIVVGDFGAGIRGGNGWALRYPASTTITINPGAQSYITDLVVCPDESTAISAGTSYTSFPATVTGQVFWLRYTGAGYPDVSAFGTVTNPPAGTSDSVIDTPTNYAADSGNNGGNYCTWNPLAKDANSTLSNGNLQSQATAVGGNTFGTIKMPNSGKYYWECEITALNTSAVAGFGLTLPYYNGNYIVSVVGIWYVASTGNISYNSTQVSYGATFGLNDVIGIAVDCDDNKIEFFKNGVSQGEADPSTYSLDVTDYVPGAGDSSGAHNNTIVGNFGQQSFSYTPPTGYVSLCTQNLPSPTVANGSSAMSATLYSGDGTNGRDITTGHSSDLVWIKARNQIDGHILCDIVRGADEIIKSNSDAAEFTATNSVTAFNSDGFTVGNNASNAQSNQSGFNYVAWSWNGGTSTESNTDGTITTSVRANTSAGFSIVSYTGNGTIGATIGHGLGATPEFLIFKNRDDILNWYCYHVANGATKVQYLNATIVATTNDFLNNTAPTSSVITLKNTAEVNANTQNIICYAWTSVAGYSAFGSYTGNGSATDGPFIFTGMRPKFILAKISSGNTDDWVIYDTERSSFNAADDELYPNQASAEVSGSRPVDILSNGFKIRNNSNKWNGASGYEYVYAAFAEHPFKTARAR